MTSVTLTEWDTLTPGQDERLSGLRLDDEATRKLAVELDQMGRLKVLELADGLSIEASSFVGVVSLGSLRINIRPKLAPDLLLRLFRFAYGLRDLHLSAPTRYGTAEVLFRDLIIHQLVAETKELLARGFLRKYVRRDEALTSPKGRIDIAEIARRGGVSTSTLPCVHYPRMMDCLINQVLLAGLRLASSVTDDLDLRGNVRCLIRLIQDGISPAELHSEVFGTLRRQMDRLTVAYEPAISLVEILYECGGVDLGDGQRMTLPGFMFDMNRFFQALLSRFFQEYLEGYRVEDEHRLRGMMGYMSGFNPLRRQAPCPRPDFAIFEGQALRALLDAKYRDLWSRDLPRDMLYQLSIYALSMERNRKATILYPTVRPEASEMVVEIREPIRGVASACVSLRPVQLSHLDTLLAGADSRRCASFAHWLALG